MIKKKVSEYGKCIPHIGDDECSFCDYDLYSIDDIINTHNMVPWTYRSQSDEFDDWCSQFPFIILKKDTLLVHSSRYTEMLPVRFEYDDYGRSTIIYDPPIMSTINWWNKYYPGQRSYKGGWFTHMSSHGGPSLGIDITYKLLDDIALLFIPPMYYDNYTGWSGSHTIEGVYGWKEKGYDKIKHDYFADDLAIRLASLGFNGYVSCDECEVYITHDAMKNVLSLPIDIDININDRYRHPSEHLLAIEPHSMLSITDMNERPIAG